jgi:ABC-type Na+ transport system ATPase subunit NatA
MLVIYMTAVMQTLASPNPDDVDRNIFITHYTIGLITPVGMLVRALLISLNMFSFLCSGSPPKMATYPGLFKLYGSPIVYLIGQSLFLFGILLWSDHGFLSGRFKRSTAPDVEDVQTKEAEVTEEIERVRNSADGLRVLHVTKTFKTRKYGKIVAVDDLTFGVKKGEMLALVGPNGAGKSSTITMVRGDLQPSLRDGQIYINGVDIATEKKTARSHLGVCPQFDAVDQMTAFEHLKFYAGVRGVKDAEHNARQIIKAVGLQKFADRMASQLSGGNKRKLSLGIALIGNPEVVLLDEPSSGMDPLAKRTMWTTLTRFVPGRSILLTVSRAIRLKFATQLTSFRRIRWMRPTILPTELALWRSGCWYEFHTPSLPRQFPRDSLI